MKYWYKAKYNLSGQRYTPGRLCGLPTDNGEAVA